MRKVKLTADETYHIYNRGAHKRDVFLNDDDYRRFVVLLHLCNSSAPIVLRDILKKYRDQVSVDDLFAREKPDRKLVDVLAYCLLPNHYHLVLRQRAEAGITKFMHRIGVGYTMYFNLKYDHSGTLFQGPFKSRHVDSEAYFRHIFAYVHLNSLDLFAPKWEEKGLPSSQDIREKVRKYPYSSYYDYCVGKRSERFVLSSDRPNFLKTQDDIEELYAFYRDLVSVW